MTRYTTKHFWRMEESEQGEWIRYEEHQKLLEDYYELDKFTDEFRAGAARYFRHLQLRLLVLFWLVIGTAACEIAKLIFWSLGL